MKETEDSFEEKPSKSQRKRDMDELKKLAGRLTELSAEHLERIGDDQVLEAVMAAKKITRGNARKRQLQFIAKLLSRIDIEPVREIVEALNASSAVYVEKFHQLESWRERLIEQDADVHDELFARFPDCDRQQLRQLTRSAINERQKGDQHIQYRKLFQFLKRLGESP